MVAEHLKAAAGCVQEAAWALQCLPGAADRLHGAWAYEVDAGAQRLHAGATSSAVRLCCMLSCCDDLHPSFSCIS